MRKPRCKNMKCVVDRQYVIASETQTFRIDQNCFIIFTKDFKYLRSSISHDLNNKFDIN